MEILQEVEKRRRKKGRKRRNKEKKRRKRKQEVVSTKPKRIKTVTETKTNRCVRLYGMKMIQTTQRWSHASCAGYTSDDNLRELQRAGLCNLLSRQVRYCSL